MSAAILGMVAANNMRGYTKGSPDIEPPGCAAIVIAVLFFILLVGIFYAH